jgi:hypothetical protein
MAELLLLNLQRDWFLSLHKRALRGDQEAIALIAALWNEYDQELPCLISDQPVDRSTPICTQVLPEFSDGKGDDNKLIGAPLCMVCRELPQAVRWSRSLKILHRMFSAKTGKNIRFHFNQSQRQHHPVR